MLRETLFSRSNRMLMIATAVTILAKSALAVYVAFIFQGIIDAATNGSTDDLLSCAAQLVAYVVSFLAVSWLAAYSKNAYLTRAIAGYRQELFSRLLAGAPARGDATSGDEVSTLVNDAEVVRNDYLTNILQVAVNGAIFVMAIAAMAWLNLAMLPVVVVAGALPLLTTPIFGGRLAVVERGLAEKNAALTSFAQECLTALPLIRSFGAEGRFGRLFSARNARAEEGRLAKGRLGDEASAVSEALGNVGGFAIFLAGALFAISGAMSVGAVIAFVQLSNYVLNPVIVVGNFLPKIRAARAVIERDEALVAARSRAAAGSAFPEGFDGAVSVRDLTFSYPGAAEPTLRGVSAEFAPGCAYALVGTSGSGKSTLLRVLSGSLEARRGAVWLGGADPVGADLASVDPARLPELYALISQEVFLFDASVRDNVTLFGDVPDAAVADACRRAGLGDLVAEKGLDYACGEVGKNLSGGERQRVAIARALLREAPLLLVDEATAALDQRAATAVENTILDVPRATKVVITHRLSEPELRRYDQIQKGTVPF